MEQISAEQRRGGRLHRPKKAVCHLGVHKSVDVDVTNLSTQGCQITIKERLVSQGANISIKLDNLRGLAAKVKWAIGGKAGLEFEHPLHESIVDHVLYGQNPSPVRSEGMITDKFGAKKAAASPLPAPPRRPTRQSCS